MDLADYHYLTTFHILNGLGITGLELRDYVERSIDEMINVREYMIKSLRDLDLRPIPSVTNFVTFHVGSPNS